MGLRTLPERLWLQPEPDLARRAAAFDAHPGSVAATLRADAAQAELAAMLGVPGGIAGAARSAWEDMCLLQSDTPDGPYRLCAAAVAFPTDWDPARKMGMPLSGLHAPIHNYESQLASGVDRFMATLKPGKIYGRTNWFIAPTGNPRWMASELPEEPFAGLTASNAGTRLFARCERQALRKLPQTGAILFTIGIYTAPLSELADGNIAMLARAVATIPPEEADRRGTGQYAASLADYARGRLADIDETAASSA